MTKDTGGSAFPSSDFDGEDHWPQGGMTLRDWFAGNALSGYLSGLQEDSPWMLDFKQAALHCYELADAMIEARNKKEEN